MVLSRKMMIKVTFFLVIVTMMFCYKDELMQVALHSTLKELNLMMEDDLIQVMRGPVDPLDPHLVTYIRNRMIHPPSQKKYHLNYDEAGENKNIYNDHRKLITSYIVMAPIIQHLFMNTTSGFFIEAGAMDGEFLSNTLILEKDKGWNGLLIEPNSGLFQDLLEKNRKCWSINACISTKPYPFRTYLLKIDRGSYMGLYYSASNSLLESRDVEARGNKHYSTYEEVQCVPLQTILKALNITKVDFFSLDVEDVEDKILENIPFEKLEIESFAVEHRSPNHVVGTFDKAIDRDFIRWFNEKGYSLYTFTRDSPHNYFFIRNGSSLHSEAFAKRPVDWDPNLFMKHFT